MVFLIPGIGGQHFLLDTGCLEIYSFLLITLVITGVLLPVFFIVLLDLLISVHIIRIFVFLQSQFENYQLIVGKIRISEISGYWSNLFMDKENLNYGLCQI